MKKKNSLDLLRKEADTAPSDFYDVPMDVVKLPSKGLIYPDDHSLSNELEVSFKPMGPLQENILASTALIKKGTVSSVLVKSCLQDQSIDVTSLVLGDKAAIMLAIRISGFGQEYKATTKCPACGEKFNHTFNLKNCPIKFLETNPVRPNENLFEFVLPKSRKTIHFSLLTDQDDLDIMATQRARKKNLSSDIDTRPTDELLKMIRSIDGKEDRDEISSFVMNKMTVLDSRSLRQYANDISPGIDMEEEVTCTQCGETDLHRVPMTLEFFWPSLSSDR